MKIKTDYVIFDLDGVISKTEKQHAKAWCATFDEKLTEKFPGSVGKEFFDIDEDYHRFIDGKSRKDGIHSYLMHRLQRASVSLSEQAFSELVDEISQEKTQKFLSLLETEGVETYPDALELIELLHARNAQLALASSSKNAELIIEKLGLALYFHVVVSGNDVEKLNLKSKPAPDIFNLAAHKLGANIDDITIIEDSISGVESAMATGCNNIIAVLRTDNPDLFAGLTPALIVSSLSPTDREIL